MVQIGNHLKTTVPHALRSRTRDFYADLLGLKRLDSPREDLDLYEFDGGFVLGLFFADPADAPSDADMLKGTWLEIKVDDPAAWTARLKAFGVREVEFPDPTRFFFQAPGGQVFRVAPLDGGL
jgi:catechol 2,3-dioxygenase-like lactoylglutathione lyase family enzyme